MILLSGKLYLLFVFAGLALLLILLSLLFEKIRNSINTNINLLVTMLLGGLWHGSSWMFLIWGGLNGLGLVLHKFWEKINPIKNQDNFVYKTGAVLITLCFISFTRIWFRSDDLLIVAGIFERISEHLGLNLILDILIGYKGVMIVMLLGYLIHWIPENMKVKYRNAFASMPLPAMVLAVTVFIFFMYQALSSEMQPFIYFQF